MNFAKRFLGVVLALLMAVSLFACSKNETPDPVDSGDGSGLRQDLKVAFVLDQAKTDGSWAQSHYEAIVRVMNDMGLTDKQVVVMEQIDAYSPDAESVIEMLAKDGNQLIVACSSGFTNAVSAVAARHPDVKFAQFEGATSDNMAAYSVREYSAVFLVGYAVARMSKSDKLGFIGCQPQASVIRGLNAFAEGVKYANEEATIKVLWANSWYDPAKEKEATNTLIGEGINSIGFYGGTTAVAIACGERDDCYTNGYNIDIHDVAPGAVVTSFVWKWDPIYKKLISMVNDGNWSSETMFPGIEDGACDVTEFNGKIMPEEIVKECNELRDKMLAGEIPVFQGPVVDNKGNVVLEEGDEFTLDDYTNMMFLLDNIIGDVPKTGD